MSLGNPAFIENLRRTIARDYSLHLNRGLTISVNDRVVRSARIELRRSDDYIPMRVTYSDRVEDDDVTVEIIGGMAAPPPEELHAQEDTEADKRYGWYIACNGRIVLAADRVTQI